ncbi:SRPBCC family protein [Anatilimnocola floriformis]|uniref:SRPBCC family protein n=1 Tax=Anatilimnocola floriformis TaxID=2948575 RepID=UPI0020C4CDB3|nr:SRPBCC domain-containing protein [Anatilimnocola floriformis]
MTNSIRREMQVPQAREQVWLAITDSETLAEWMFPNDFEPRVGHHFTFRVPANPKLNFEGLTVRCEVLECDPPRDSTGGHLAFSWSAGAPVENTHVSFQLERDGQGTRILFEHSGFDLSHPFGEHAFKGAEYGWAKMLKTLSEVVAKPS